MSAPGAQRAYLLAHPDAGGKFVRSIAAEAQLMESGTLLCHYTLRGETPRLRVPQAGAGGRTDGLWKHTCFEAFIGATDGPGYYEFNFSPALDWAAYRFKKYRTGMSPAPLARPPGLQVRHSSEGLELAATVPLAELEPLRQARSLRVALAAVIEQEDGGLAYWALRHPPGKPDFHHPDGFTLELRLA